MDGMYRRRRSILRFGPRRGAEREYIECGLARIDEGGAGVCLDDAKEGIVFDRASRQHPDEAPC